MEGTFCAVSIVCNDLGQLDTFTDSVGNAIAYKYDGAGNLTELTYPGSPARTVTYAYDTADRLATVTDWAARVTRFRYDAQSRLWKIELPNGTQRVFTYDSAGRVAGVRDEVAAGGALVSQFTLGYDALDRIVEETTLPEPAEFAVTTASMSYDDDDRLTAWNALVTQSDADGNLTKGPLAGVLTTFNYDARNRLASVGNTGYTYDAENRRISRAAPGSTTTFVHDPNAAFSRLLQSATGGTTTRYVYAGSLLLYAETGTSIRVHHYDYRGSTVALSDGTGAVLGRVTYGSYGEIVARSGDTATEFLYNGRDGVVTDPNGLYHMRARYYSPETRRFLNADPIGFAAGTNWYAYVGGSPVMFVDPRGLDAESDARIAAERNLLVNRATTAFGVLESRGVPHKEFPSEANSCYMVNTAVYAALGPFPEGWSIQMEHRYRKLPFGSWGYNYRDHWAIVAVDPKQKQYLVDYWGDRPIFEDPNEWFRANRLLFSGYPVEGEIEEGYVPIVPYSDGGKPVLGYDPMLEIDKNWPKRCPQ